MRRTAFAIARAGLALALAAPLAGLPAGARADATHPRTAPGGTPSTGTAAQGTAARGAAARGAVQPTPADVASTVNGIVPGMLAKDRIPGAAVVVVAGGRQVFTQGYGVADVNRRTPLDARSTGLFIGSMAKLFTATAALQLVDQGKLDLHTDVNRYLTGFRIRDTYPGRPVTLENLLTHTAGFDDDIVGTAEADPARVEPLGRNLAKRQPPRVRPPGTVVAYDNYGTALAGYLVEIASGEPFARYVDEHVLRPLGMTATTFAQPHPAAIDATLAHGYRPNGSGHTAEKGQYGSWSPTGAGAVSPPADMSRFMLAQLDNDPRLGRDVAKRMQQRHFAQDPRIPGMGYQFEERPRNGRRLLFKDGDVPGFHDQMALLPDEGIGIYVAFNGDGTDTVAGWDGVSLIDRLVDRYLPGRTAAAPAVRTGDVAKYAGTYRSVRTSHHALTKISTLVSSVSVRADGPGALTTTGLALDPAAATRHWTQVGPGLFQERNGQDLIAFDRKGILSASTTPAEAYEKLEWADSPALYLPMFGAGALVLLLCFLGIPVAALVRRLRHRPARSRASRAAWLAAWGTGALGTAFLAGFASLMTDSNALQEKIMLGSPSLTVLPVVLAVAFIPAAAVLAGTVAAWWKGWWGWSGRLSYTLIALAGVAFLKVALTYNLVALPFA
ncbi:beta-lactamase family protein [Actinoallomurus spadix]|nr:serine hydrolase domain-containing protein [Actinoallomurus spadix]MCO5990250.1 beta-lactamase family protein [Actinoallomurus spadix]